jgi:hypothetical protein
MINSISFILVTGYYFNLYSSFPFENINIITFSDDLICHSCSLGAKDTIKVSEKIIQSQSSLANHGHMIFIFHFFLHLAQFKHLENFIFWVVTACSAW